MPFSRRAEAIDFPAPCRDPGLGYNEGVQVTMKSLLQRKDLSAAVVEAGTGLLR
jgi:hypothetical protein